MFWLFSGSRSFHTLETAILLPSSSLAVATCFHWMRFFDFFSISRIPVAGVRKYFAKSAKCATMERGRRGNTHGQRLFTALSSAQVDINDRTIQCDERVTSATEHAARTLIGRTFEHVGDVVKPALLDPELDSSDIEVHNTVGRAVDDVEKPRCQCAERCVLASICLLLFSRTRCFLLGAVLEVGYNVRKWDGMHTSGRRTPSDDSDESGSGSRCGRDRGAVPIFFVGPSSSSSRSSFRLTGRGCFLASLSAMACMGSEWGPRQLARQQETCKMTACELTKTMGHNMPNVRVLCRLPLKLTKNFISQLNARLACVRLDVLLR